MLTLIVRVDDAGSFHSANHAIRQVCEQGIARNISLLACGPYIEEAAAELRSLPGICFGLHVCLNAEWDQVRWGPVLGKKAAACLTEADGSFTRSPQVLHERGVTAAEMMPEIEAQYMRLVRLGFPVRYMDEHMGIGWVGGLRAALSAYAKQHGLIYCPEVARLELSPSDSDKNLAVRLLAAIAKAEGLRLFITHPAFDDAEMRLISGVNAALGSVGRQRDQDRQALCAPEVVAAYRKGIIRLATYADLEPRP